MCAAALSVLCAAAPHGATAQPNAPALSPFVGVWEGRTEGGVELALGIDPEGRYILSWLSGPGAGNRPTGRTELRGAEVVLKYRDGEMLLHRQADGRLGGSYFTGRSRGGVTFAAAAAQQGSYEPRSIARPVADAGPQSDWAVGRWEGGIFSIGGAHGSTGGSSMNNRPRSLIIEKDGDGRFHCRWSASPTAAGGFAKSCRIGASSLSLLSAAGEQIDVTKTGADSLVGPYKANGDFNAYSQNQVHLTRRRSP